MAHQDASRIRPTFFIQDRVQFRLDGRQIFSVIFNALGHDEGDKPGGTETKRLLVSIASSVFHDFVEKRVGQLGRRLAEILGGVPFLLLECRLSCGECPGAAIADGPSDALRIGGEHRRKGVEVGLSWGQRRSSRNSRVRIGSGKQRRPGQPKDDQEKSET